MANQGRAGWTIQDNSQDKNVFSMNVGVVTGASLPGLLTNLGDFQDALIAVLDSTVYKNRLSVYDNVVDPAVPASLQAQNEKKWLVHYHDSQEAFGAVANVFFGEKYVCEIPGAKESLIVGGTNRMNIEAATPGATFVTEFQDAFLAPSGGTLIVDYVEYV